MDYRFNEATINRPEGSRPLDATLLFVDLVEKVDQLRGEKAFDTNDLNGITVVKTDVMTAVVTLMKKDSVSKRNESGKALTLIVLSGKLHLQSDNGNFDLHPAQLLHLNPLLPHEITALEESVVLQITH